MAKERHRALSEALSEGKTDRNESQKSMIFLNKLPIKAAGFNKRIFKVL